MVKNKHFNGLSKNPLALTRAAVFGLIFIVRGHGPLLHDTLRNAYVIYGGDKTYTRNGVRVLGWKDVTQVRG